MNPNRPKKLRDSNFREYSGEAPILFGENDGKNIGETLSKSLGIYTV